MLSFDYKLGGWVIEKAFLRWVGYLEYETCYVIFEWSLSNAGVMSLNSENHGTSQKDPSAQQILNEHRRLRQPLSR